MGHTPFRPSVVRRVARALLLYAGVFMSMLCAKSTSALAGKNRLTTFGGEKQSRWGLEGRAALVTGGTKVRFVVPTQ